MSWLKYKRLSFVIANRVFSGLSIYLKELSFIYIVNGIDFSLIQ
jgi:hypothetical protein